LGVSLTQLKRICRENDIPRWPYRKLQSIHNKIAELKDSLDTSDELTCDRIKNKILSLENEIQFIKTHPRSIVASGNVDRRKRNSIQKKRWSLPSESALSALGDNASNIKRWSIGSDGEETGEEDDYLSSGGSDNEGDDEIFEVQDPSFQDISNRFKGLLHPGSHESPLPPPNVARPQLPSLEPVISKVQTNSRRLSLNPYVLKNLSTNSMPTTPTLPRSPFEQDNSSVDWKAPQVKITSSGPTIPSLNINQAGSSRSDNLMYTPRGTHVAGFYPPPNQHHSSQFNRYSLGTNLRESYQQYQQQQQQPQQHQSPQPNRNSSQPLPNPQHRLPPRFPTNQQQNGSQENTYKPPPLALPARNFIAQPQNPQHLPRISSLDVTTNSNMMNIDTDDNRFDSPLHRKQHSLPTLPKFNELENQVYQYERTMRHHSPQLPPRQDPFAMNHDPFIKPAHHFAPSPIMSYNSTAAAPQDLEQERTNFLEKLFRKQIPFFKKRNSTSPAPKVM
jgi:hypothetical protein